MTLCHVYQIPQDRLCRAVFEGDETLGIARDDEAAKSGRSIYLKRILNGNRHDNFWEMGEVGPC